MIMRIAINIRTHLTTRLSGGTHMLRVLFIASAATVGTAQAQSPITTPSHSSQSGVQSVITHIRDSLQHRLSARKPRSQNRQPQALKPDTGSSDR
jgi:hypothetical protein